MSIDSAWSKPQVIARKLEELASNAPAGTDILEECLEIAEFLIKKNISYGNSALEPARIFSKASTLEQIYVRLDDKLNRFMRGAEYPGDNDIDDLLGYLILLKIALRRNNGIAQENEGPLSSRSVHQTTRTSGGQLYNNAG